MNAPLNAPKRKVSGYAREGTRLVTHPFKAEIRWTCAGSPVLLLHRHEPAHNKPSHRRLAQTIYEIAARMEQLGDGLDARWVITAEPHDGRVIIELASDTETMKADEMIATVVAEFSLA